MPSTHGSIAQPSRAVMGDFDLPPDRQALLAPRQAFRQLKQAYLQAIDVAAGPQVDGLRHRVCCAEQPSELWRLRCAVFEALPAHGANATRAALKRHFDMAFPLSDLPSVFSSI